MDVAKVAYLDPEVEDMLVARRARARGITNLRETWAHRGCAVLVAAGGGLLLAVSSPRALSPVLLVCLVAGYALATRVNFEVGPGTFQPTELFVVPMLLLLPPPVVPAAVAAGMLAGHLPDVLRGKASTATFAPLVASSGFVLLPAAVAIALGTPGAAAGRDWLLVPLLVGAQFVGDFGIAAACSFTALGVRPRQLVEPMRWVFTFDALLAPVGLAVAAAASSSRFAVLLPISALYVLARLARDREAAISNSLELSRAYRGTAFLLGDVVEADDPYTGTHSRAVVELAVAVADRLNVSMNERRLTELVALLHDVGKIRVPKEIIHKPGPLTAAERVIVETHTRDGQELLSTVGGLLDEIGRLVRSCHERWDGDGYPDGLAGEQIPLVSRIVCCADALNAMTTDRPYRAALPLSVALDELRRCSGTQFDPAVVAAVVEHVGSTVRVSPGAAVRRAFAVA